MKSITSKTAVRIATAFHHSGQNPPGVNLIKELLAETICPNLGEKVGPLNPGRWFPRNSEGPCLGSQSDRLGQLGSVFIIIFVIVIIILITVIIIIIKAAIVFIVAVAVVVVMAVLVIFSSSTGEDDNNCD